MEFMNRGVRPNAPASPGSSEEGTNHNTSSKPSGKFKKLKVAKWTGVPAGILLVSVTIVLVAVSFLIFFADTNKEGKFVDKTKMQAVFLNNGQVYFGNITDLNSSYLNLANIYYLRVNQQVQPGQQATQNDVSLVKLGCELHGPQDRMTVNREQVTFWENLKDDGQVAKAVAEYVKQNPNGQNCQQQAQQQQQSNTNNTSNTENNENTGDTNNTTNNTNTNNSNTGNTNNTPQTNN